MEIEGNYDGVWREIGSIALHGVATKTIPPSAFLVLHIRLITN